MALHGHASELNLTTRADHFADTRLNFAEARSAGIPSEYTVRLAGPAHLGGRVVDADGQPVAGAQVGFFQDADQSLLSRTESHEYGWVQATTDTTGHWEVERLADDVISRTGASASQSDHVMSDYVWLGRDATALKEMRSGAYVFHLKRPFTLTGVVVDKHDGPVVGATVFLGLVGESPKRSSTTDSTGAFSLRGAAPGPNRVSANAHGYAPVSKNINVTTDGQSVKFVMKPGRALRFHVTDTDKKPVSGAKLWLNPFAPDLQDGVQAEVTLTTDGNGDAQWDDAPDSELRFSVSCSRYMRVPFLRAKVDGRVQNVILQNALTVHGNVTDADTGKPIRRFTIVSGWPTATGGQVQAQWSTIDRFWLPFTNGVYRHTYEEGVVADSRNPGYILRFEADGYASFVSRAIDAIEGEVQIDARLKRNRAPSVTVLTPDGRPAANAQVGLIGPGGWTTLIGPTINPMASSSTTRLMADNQGRIGYSSEDASVVLLIAVHDTGFGLASPADLAEQPTWTLMPYGTIRGTVTKAGIPVVGRSMVLHSFGTDGQAVRLDPQGFHATTDATGRYEIPNVPPGTWTLAQRVTVSDGSYAISQSRATNVNLQPGGTTVANIALGGSRVVAKVRLPPTTPEHAWVIEGWMHPGVQVPTTPQEPPGGEAARSDVAAAKLAEGAPTPNAYSFFLQADGSYAAEDVDPGVYVFEFHAIDASALSEPAPSTDSKSPSARNGTKTLKAMVGPVQVGDGVQSLDLGVVVPQ